MTGHHRSAVSTRLGLRPGLRVWVGGHHLEAKRAITNFLADTIRPTTGPLDAAFIAADTADEADYFVQKLKPRLTESATVWIVSADASVPHNTVRVALDDTFGARAVVAS